MNGLTLFYLETCPYCKRALGYMEELKKEDPAYAGIPVKMIEESRNRELSDKYDYSYVPCYYIGDEKIAEGVLGKEDVKRVFERALGR